MRLSLKDAMVQLENRGIRVAKLHGRYTICDTATGKVYEGRTGTEVVQVAKRFNDLDAKLIEALNNVKPMSQEELEREARREMRLEAQYS